jgi:hypothetical protein
MLVALVVACDNAPHNPIAPSRPPVPTPPPTATFTVELSGPDRLAPGQSAQYTVTVRSSDGVTRVPTSIHWIASPPEFVQVDASGLATAGTFYGGAAVTADVTVAGLGVRGASRSVIVLPDGTYRIVGTVRDVGGAAVPDAVITVTPGPLTIATDLVGHYSLYGVPADAEFHITAFGYEPFVQNLNFNNHATQNFQLASAGQPPDFAGLYALTVDVIDGCQNSSPLPAELQHRRYDAVVGQNGLALTVTLTEPGKRFPGRVDAAGATFALNGDWEANYPSVVEQLADGTVLVLSGEAVTTRSAAGLSGTLNGGLSKGYLADKWDFAFFPFSCSGRLGFTLTRR